MLRTIILVLAFLIISTSCSNFHMEKRRYNRGFHISYAKKFPSTKNVKEREEVSVDPTDAPLANTKLKPMMLVKHKNVINSTKVKTEPSQQVAKADLPIANRVQRNPSLITKRIGSESFIETYLHLRTKKSIASRTIEHMTIGRRHPNVNSMASAASRPLLGNGEGWTIAISLLAALIVFAVLTVAFAGTAAGEVLLIALIVTGSLSAAFLLAVLILLLIFCLTFSD